MARRGLGLRQRDLADLLGGGTARSTIANIETGREPPTPRLWLLLRRNLPEVAEELATAYAQARAEVAERSLSTSLRRANTGQIVPSELVSAQRQAGWLVRPFTIDELRIVYVFRDRPSPEEIVEVRTVRATEGGADGYELALVKDGDPGFVTDTEPLWGGHIEVAQSVVGHRAESIRRVSFPRALRRGQRHQFALRTWVERDPDPDNSVAVDFTLPTTRLSIDLHFRGPMKPRHVWAFGPVADADTDPVEPNGGSGLDLSPAGSVATTFEHPELGPSYGVAWRWPE